MRVRLQSLRVGLVLSAFSVPAFAAPSRPMTSPNVLLILSDDQGWAEVGAQGHPVLQTPHLDALVEGGARFESFSVSPLCAPTRAALLTGRYPLRGGVWQVANGYETLAPDEKTVAHLLGEAGYATGLFGKWHNGDSFPSSPQGMGFQEFIGFRDGGVRYFDPPLEHNGKPFVARGYSTEIFTDAALDFIEKSVEKKQPFFAYLAFNAPHSPCAAPENFLAPYKNRGLDDKTVATFGAIAALDENVGRLVRRLEALQVRQNTIVVFLSDNGPERGRFNAGLRGHKGQIYEGGVRVPCFFSYPGHIPARRVVASPAAHIDLLPTLADWCHLRPTRSLDGQSLRPVLEAKTSQAEMPEAAERTLFFFQPPPQARPQSQPGGGARRGRWKLVENQLFDLQNDPGETTDLAGQKSTIFADLQAQYAAWWQIAARERDFQIPPIEVGHEAENPVLLKSHRATFENLETGGQASGRWFLGWKTNSRAAWDVHIARAGRYEIALLGQCPPEMAGLFFEVGVGQTTIEAPLRATPVGDRVWTPIEMGTLNLKPGRARVEVRSAQASSFLLKGVLLRRLP